MKRSTGNAAVAVATILAGAVAGNAGAAKARPGLVAPGLSGQARAALAAEVAEARRADAAAFASLARVRGFLPSSYRATRARRPEVSRELSALGPRALLPMIEAMALTGFPTRAELAPPERIALETGLFEAVGALADPRAEPVLVAALEQATEQHILHGAARALGHLCADSAVDGAERHLTALAMAAGPRQLAAVDALAVCATVPAATTLSLVLGRQLDAATATEAARALGELGSSWGWEARGDRALGERVRQVAAAGLVAACAHAPDGSQAAIQQALAMVGHAATDALLAEARAANRSNEEGRRRLDALAAAWNARRR